MYRFSRLNDAFGLTRSGKDRSRQASRQHRSVRLMLEALEDRVVPSGGNPGQQLLITPPGDGGGSALARSAAIANATPIESEIIAANNVSANFCPNSAQTVTLNARTLASTLTIGTTHYDLTTGTVTFSIKNVGSVQAPVSGGKASASITLPAGLAPGSYTIAVSYTDSSGQIVENTQATLTVTTCAASAAAAANQMLQNLNAYLLNIDLQIYLSGLEGINTIFTQLTGQLPPGTPGSALTEGDPLEQLYDQVVSVYTNLFTSILPLPPAAEAPDVEPLGFGATGGGESFAASSPSVIGD